MQEYLNNTDDHLYGLVTNGLQLRLLRDNSRLSQVAYVEFNLEQIFEEDSYADFVTLFRLLHSSRMPQTGQQSEKCVLEDYHQLSLDSGARIKDKLRNAFHQSLLILGRGLLSVNSERLSVSSDTGVISTGARDERSGEISERQDLSTSLEMTQNKNVVTQKKY